MDFSKLVGKSSEEIAKELSLGGNVVIAAKDTGDEVSGGNSPYLMDGDSFIVPTEKEAVYVTVNFKDGDALLQGMNGPIASHALAIEVNGAAKILLLSSFTKTLQSLDEETNELITHRSEGIVNGSLKQPKSLKEFVTTYGGQKMTVKKVGYKTYRNNSYGTGNLLEYRISK